MHPPTNRLAHVNHDFANVRRMKQDLLVGPALMHDQLPGIPPDIAFVI